MTATAHIYHVIQSPPEDQPEVPVRDKGWTIIWEDEKRVTARELYATAQRAREVAGSCSPKKIVVHHHDIELVALWKEEGA